MKSTTVPLENTLQRANRHANQFRLLSTCLGMPFNVTLCGFEHGPKLRASHMTRVISVFRVLYLHSIMAISWLQKRAFPSDIWKYSWYWLPSPYWLLVRNRQWHTQRLQRTWHKLSYITYVCNIRKVSQLVSTILEADFKRFHRCHRRRWWHGRSTYHSNPYSHTS